jgi:predicted transposase YbfD/YdcC
VTTGAVGTQTEIAAQIVEEGGGYLLAVKENQGHLYEDLQHLFAIDQREGLGKLAITTPENWMSAGSETK